MTRNEPLTRQNAGGRYWDRTSDLFGVNDGRRPGQRPIEPLTSNFFSQCAPAFLGEIQARDARVTHDLGPVRVCIAVPDLAEARLP